MGIRRFASEIPKDWFLQVYTSHGRRKISAAADDKPQSRAAHFN